MKIRNYVLLCACGLLLMSGCGTRTQGDEPIPMTKQVSNQALKTGKPAIVSSVGQAYSKVVKPDTLPQTDARGLGIDLRSLDVSSFDLTTQDLTNVTFDENTKWPNQLPVNFSPSLLLEKGKDPGLGIRELHDQGITGKGVNIAILDQGLLLEHKEYKNNIWMYETMNSYDYSAQSHGSAVTSIAVGKQTGVAPDAHVYYIATTFGDYDVKTKKMKDNVRYIAEGIERILDINQQLSKQNQIRVISISRGFSKDAKKADKLVYNAIEKAKRQGVLVLTPSLENNYDYEIFGMKRDMSEDINDLDFYSIDSRFSSDETKDLKEIYVPMGNRSFASAGSASQYEYVAQDAMDWTCPWLAGMYALCLQVNPQVTPEDFLKIAYESGETVEGKLDYQEYNFMNGIQPKNLIKAVKDFKK